MNFMRLFKNSELLLNDNNSLFELKNNNEMVDSLRVGKF